MEALTSRSSYAAVGQFAIEQLAHERRCVFDEVLDPRRNLAPADGLQHLQKDDGADEAHFELGDLQVRDVAMNDAIARRLERLDRCCRFGPMH
ncbi:MAG TPA: hypothetical protein VGM44_07230, partial [Polyangiaceae bacterium]